MSSEYDVLIKDTIIVDGTGDPSFTGSVGITGARVRALGDISGTATVEIDGHDLITCPGFIDPHSHADLSILQYPLAENLVMQGVTTFLGGNCGLCVAPSPPTSCGSRRNWTTADVLGGDADAAFATFGQFLDAVSETGIAVNYAPLLGHNAIRASVMGEDFKRPARHEEILSMKAQVEDALKGGVYGLSCFYDPGPGEYSTPEEMLALLEPVARLGAAFYPHTRHIQSQWPSEDAEEYGYGIYHGPVEDIMVGRYRGYLEAIDLARKSGARLHIPHLSHAFIVPQPHPAYLEEAIARATLSLIDDAKAGGLHLTFDVMPVATSIAGRAPLIGAFSKWVGLLGREKFLKAARSRELRDDVKRTHAAGRLKFGMIHTRADPYWSECFTILQAKDTHFAAKTVDEISRQLGLDPIDAMLEVLVSDPDATWAQVVDKRQSDVALPIYLKHPLAMPSSDVKSYPACPAKGDPANPYGDLPAPLAYGAFANYFGTYVREKNTLALEEAVHKATEVPARAIGLQGRGVIKREAYADIVLFDLKTIRMKGTLDHPAQPPDGIKHVLVNGQLVWSNKEHTGARAGMVLRAR